MTNAPIAKLLDHALLHPTMTDSAIETGCQLAARLNVATVCVKPYSIPRAVDVLSESEVDVGTVIGFPHGSHPTEVKASEAEWAIRHGAKELDMVVNVGKVLQGDWEFVREDIRTVVDLGHQHDAFVKVIFETDFVSERDSKIKLCEICCEVKADWVKTSTGFGFTKQTDGYGYLGATEEDIRLMVEICQGTCQVKASGGIRSYDDACKFRDLGCSRLGTSASETIVAGQGKDVTSY